MIFRAPFAHRMTIAGVLGVVAITGASVDAGTVAQELAPAHLTTEIDPSTPGDVAAVNDCPIRGAQPMPSARGPACGLGAASGASSRPSQRRIFGTTAGFAQGSAWLAEIWPPLANEASIPASPWRSATVTSCPA